MNRSFFALEADKQNEILNAGFAEFSQKGYEKANMADLAAKAGVSKSLLFYYFKNKRELFLYLWNEAARENYEAIQASKAYELDSLFDMMDAGLKAKISWSRKNPQKAIFVLRSLLENDDQIRDAVMASYSCWFERQAVDALEHQDCSSLRPDLSPQMVLEQIRLASEGYMWRNQPDSLMLETIIQDAENMMRLWRQIYSNPDKKLSADSSDAYSALKQTDPSETRKDNRIKTPMTEQTENQMVEQQTQALCQQTALPKSASLSEREQMNQKNEPKESTGELTRRINRSYVPGESTRKMDRSGQENEYEDKARKFSG